MDYRLLAQATWDIMKYVLLVIALMTLVLVMAIYLSTTMFFIVGGILMAIYWIITSIRYRYVFLAARKKRNY